VKRPDDCSGQAAIDDTRVDPFSRYPVLFLIAKRR
jgi:hypothetical protein